jgi:DNA invertase Pin-like site-specific DNA recombinase
MRATIYTRFSTDRQREASLEDQQRVCVRVADREGFKVGECYSDAAISGGTAARPGYQRMLAAARRHEFDAIIAEDMKRLWREQAEQWRALKELQDVGVHVITTSGVDSRQANFEIIASVMGAAGELERKEAAYRTRRGLEGRARDNKPKGGRAYGYVAARDSGTGQIEINEQEAATVRRIFEMYASGMCPRSIAAKLNADKVPSPGATWNRTVRRKSGWVASAIHGDVNRGNGVLNNRRYAGVVVWGRSQWKRGAADSRVRRVSMDAKPLHETLEERLRIVPQELWDRVKARQMQRRKEAGALVKGGLRKRAAGGGRKGKYLFTGLLVCDVCGASFVLRNREYYCCASHWNGASCSNTINVPRKLVQDVLLDGIREDLSDPEVIAEVERRMRAAVRERLRGPQANYGKRIAELQREIGNVTDAIAAGILKSSPALAQRLQAAESELARLDAASRVAAASLVVPDVRKRFLSILDRLGDVLLRDPERGREELRQVLEERIRLIPDESGKFLWADYALGINALLPSGNNGSGGRILEYPQEEGAAASGLKLRSRG